MKKRIAPCVLSSFVLLLVLFLVFPPAAARGASAEELRRKIDERNRIIADLENEVAGYQRRIGEAGRESKGLQSAIGKIRLEQKKLAADIAVAENRIAAAALTIDELEGDIYLKEERIEAGRAVIGRSLRAMNRSESVTTFAVLLSGTTLSQFWQKVDELRRFSAEAKRENDVVKEVRRDLIGRKTTIERKKRELAALRGELADRRAILENNRREKASLLAAAKSTESNYRRLVAEKLALRDSFARELLKFESQLKLEVDRSKLPAMGSKALSWPLDSVSITQYFGATAFALSGAYNGQGHNGIDLRAAPGTPVRAASAGRVTGAGNTDLACPGASYGRWILIEHGNGLSTLYAHLSLIKVSEGQSVAQGEVIGYSGDSGYATGPHLHFTVYATQGVRVMARKSRVCGSTYRMPVASLNAYLNPLSYL